MAPVSCICCSSLQYWLSCSWLQNLSFARCSIGCCLWLHGSGIISCCRCSWLQSPVSVVLWLQYLLSFVSPVSSICHSLVAPVSVGVHGSSLQYFLSFVSPVVPLSVVACGGSSGCCLWLQSPVSVVIMALVSPVVHGSSQYLSFVVRGTSIICRLAPVAPAVAQVLSIVTSCGSKLSLVAPVAVVVACPEALQAGNHLVFWRFFCKIAFYCCISPNIER